MFLRSIFGVASVSVAYCQSSCSHPTWTTSCTLPSSISAFLPILTCSTLIDGSCSTTMHPLIPPNISHRLPNQCYRLADQLPELNPIENLWSWMKRQVEKRCSLSQQDLEAAISDVWEALTPVDIEKYYPTI